MHRIFLGSLLFFNFLFSQYDINKIVNATNLDPIQIKEIMNYWDNHSKLEYKAFSVYYPVVANLIKKFNLTKGCEIGVATGNHSVYLLTNTALKKLYSIDPYISYGDPTNLAQHKHNQQSHDILYYFVLNRLSFFKERSELIRMFSSEASKLFKDNELDFIFLDANHTYEYVKEDLTLWYNKIRKGGLFLGDDYCTVHAGVPKAVNEFFGKKKIKVFQDKQQPRIWWIIKP